MRFSYPFERERERRKRAFRRKNAEIQIAPRELPYDAPSLSQEETQRERGKCEVISAREVIKGLLVVVGVKTRLRVRHKPRVFPFAIFRKGLCEEKLVGVMSSKIYRCCD